MGPDLPTIHGRGAASNPPNRFEALRYQRDPDAPPPLDPEDEVAPRTRFLVDPAKTIIATNDSPDVGFEASVNPYRGCEHGCVYCMGADTLVLMADGAAKPIAEIRAGDEICGTVRRGWYRRFVHTRVLDHWRTRKLAYRVTLEDGTELVSSGDHRFLTDRGWKFVTGTQQGCHRRPHLTPGNDLRGLGRLAGTPPAIDEGYRRGYLGGMIRGDGHLASYRYAREGRAHGDQHQFRLALVDGEALARSRSYLASFGIATHEFEFQAARMNRRAMRGLRSHARASVERIRQLVGFPCAPDESYCRGFLAGIYDAEGSYSQGILRIANTDARIIDQVLGALRSTGFAPALDRVRRGRLIDYVRLLGGVREHVRFFRAVAPAIARKRDIAGIAVKNEARLRVVAVEPLGRQLDLFDITTGTGDFIANGVISHNCYARPTHEYLGMSAGLDFETRILVKPNAPELLRRELSARSWRPKTIALSGVTDCYQPVERHLKLTRGCLEVLAELRNPAVIITKNHLVTRDADLLAELARHGAIAVNVSVTTLDESLCGAMEPRTSRPRRRLEAIEALARAGVPVGALVAPVIPGLTDREVPAIVDAVARAGARWAHHVMLRLPFGVKDLFEDWLARTFPERKEKVLARIREVRGGKLNDPRFGVRFRGEGEYARQIEGLFGAACARAGLGGEGGAFPQLSTAAFRRPGGEQLSLF